MKNILLPLIASAFISQANANETPQIDKIRINEINIGQVVKHNQHSDFIELYSSNASARLSDLHYLILTCDGAGNHAVISQAISLSDSSFTFNHFLIRSSKGKASKQYVDLYHKLGNQGSLQNTHIIVRNFSGRVGQCLDVDSDGQLDSQPWSQTVDAIGIHFTRASILKHNYAEQLGGQDIGLSSKSQQSIARNQQGEWNISPASPGEANGSSSHTSYSTGPLTASIKRH